MMGVMGVMADGQRAGWLAGENWLAEEREREAARESGTALPKVKMKPGVLDHSASQPIICCRPRVRLHEGLDGAALASCRH